MDSAIKQEIDNCFSYRNDPAGCYGALAKIEAHLDGIDFNDDDDLEDMIAIILNALRMDGNNVELVEFLISKGFDVNAKLVGKDCLILRAAVRGLSSAVIEKLAALGADLYSETNEGDNVLLLAAQRDEELAVYFAESCDLSRLDKTDKFGITPLMYAAMKNYIRLAKSLIAHGSDVNAVGARPSEGNGYWISMDGVTPLALALRHGNVEIAKMLLEAGADETIRDAQGNPPIFSLLRYPFRFFENGPRVGSPIFGQKCEILSFLKELELTDAHGYTVLMRSLCSSEDSFDAANAYNNLPIALALIERGANIEAAGNDGKRPLHLAVLAGDAEKALVKAGADLNAQDNEGNTPLLIACKQCGEKLARYLIKAGADITVRNSKGETAMDIAAERGYSDALELMMDRQQA